MKKILQLCVFLCIFAGAFNSFSKEKYAKNSSDAMIFGVAGDISTIKENDSIGRFVEIPVPVNVQLDVPAFVRTYSKNQISEVEAAPMADKAPQRIMDWLLCYDGTSKSEKRLLELASSRNREFSGRSPIAEGELRKHLSDLLTNNFIYLQNLIPYRPEGQLENDTARYCDEVADKVSRGDA
ncbi:MAG: hypothetical protein NC217_04335 [Muribaculaceae bacterium]|nr:hypothetical protein [Muribaculaceae bacterium]